MSSAANNCAGGVVFSFNDALWKVGNYNVGLGGLVNADAGDTSYNTYNPDGFAARGLHPDGVANEEYFGIVTADRQPKQAYTALRDAFAGAPPLLAIDTITATPNPVVGTQTQLAVTWKDGMPPFSFVWEFITKTMTFSDASIANPVATFPSAGTYLIQVTMSDGANTHTASKTAFKSSSIKTLFALSIGDPGLPVTLENPVTFIVTAKDQFQNDMMTPTNLIWTTDAGATINQSGVFQATTPGPHTVTVHSGAITGQITITVAGSGNLAPPVIDGFASFNSTLHRSDSLSIHLSGGARIMSIGVFLIYDRISRQRTCCSFLFFEWDQ